MMYTSLVRYDSEEVDTNDDGDETGEESMSP